MATLLARQRLLDARALWAAVLCAIAVASCGDDGPTQEELESAQCLADTSAMFDQRIKPLLETDRPSTCNQCHLSGVDLGLFVRDSMCETRACLLENGLVDPTNIDASLILGWIARAQPDSELITQQVIDEEYEGFRDFLTQIVGCSGASCKGVHCGAAKGPGSCERAGEPSQTTLTDPAGGCDSVSIEQSFRDNVFTWRDRCFPCHFSNQPNADASAPRWISVDSGGCDTASVATLRNVIDGGYIDIVEPTQSLLLRKPLAESAGGVLHGGGDKFHDADDPAYVSFLSFIQHFADCANSGQPY